VKYAAIADWAADKEYSVTFMCAQLGVVRQGYYRWLADGPCQRERTDAELTEQIREIHRDLHGHPGVRRVWAELVVRGVQVACKRVWRLMRAAGLRGRFPRVSAGVAGVGVWADVAAGWPAAGGGGAVAGRARPVRRVGRAAVRGAV
jgi:HTH-like domain